ncbi:hypothetical protein [Rhizobium sp. P32RR-XVIII]|nr:hypothetical protein [Rhizobium sp. P32RR-XVIII]
MKRLQANVAELIRAGIATEQFAPRNVDAAASCFCDHRPSSSLSNQCHF